MLLRSFLTPDYHGFAIKFCPFKPSRLACVTSKNFGISGTGSLFIVEDVLLPTASHILTSPYKWKDGLYDLAWSEVCEGVLVTASGDACLQIWNLRCQEEPVRVHLGHEKEVVSIDWNPTRTTQLLVSGSWDKTAKTWDCHTGSCINTFRGHKGKIYSVAWSPFIPDCFASVSEDGQLLLWNTPNSSQPVIKVNTDTSEVLSCAWNYYDKDLLVTTGTDNIITGWDLRNSQFPVFQLVGHSYPAKKVKFSPHMKSILSTVSYDFTTRIWDINCKTNVQCFEHHSEFVSGLDFSSQITGLMADCGWDQKIHIFSWPCLIRNVQNIL